MANEYNIGQKVRIGGTFTVNGAVTDPTTITLILRVPNGERGTFTFAGGSVIKDSTGVYHLDYITILAGFHSYSWEGAGAVTAVIQDEFKVVESLV